MDRAEAIERIEKLRSEVWTGAEVVAGEDFKALSVAIDSLREQELARNSHDVTRACEWISVEDALPGTERVLVTNGEFVKEGYRRPDGVWKYGKEEHMRWERLSCHPVTHWMPLPEPPEEGG